MGRTGDVQEFTEGWWRPGSDASAEHRKVTDPTVTLEMRREEGRELIIPPLFWLGHLGG